MNKSGRSFLKTRLVVTALLGILLCCRGTVFAANDSLITPEISEHIRELMDKGDIPGLSVVVIRGDSVSMQNFGYSDLSTKTPVTSNTLFQVGSCSKAFTALAALRLASEGKLDLDAPVSKYLPWFYVTYKDDQRPVIKVRQLLHHTSGIPFRSISNIPADSSSGALERTVRSITGIELSHLPGTKYEYATINYDVVGLIIQVVSGMPYEEYVQQNILLPLGMVHTSIGRPAGGLPVATGYKIGFFAPREYNAPVFRGNNPAGYVVSNAEDMCRWLRIQMQLEHTALDSIIRASHVPDLTVEPFGQLSYAYGWMIDPYSDPMVIHGGYNPNYTADVEFYSDGKVGVVLLANSNSLCTDIIGKYLVAKLKHKELPMERVTGDKVDVICSVLSVIFSLFILLVIAFLVYRVKLLLTGKLKREKPGPKQLRTMALVVIAGIPYFIGIYLVPYALTGFTWESIYVWTPVSFKVCIALLITVIVLTYFFYFFSRLYPGKNKYRNSIPVILFLSILSGLANTAVLFIITSSFYSDVKLPYLLYYFVLAYGLCAIGMKVSQTKMIRLTNGITLDVRIFLINKILSTRYQNFESFMDGRAWTTLNGDTSVIAGSANLFIGLISSGITIFSAFLYMATISLGSTLIMLGVMLVLGFFYYHTSQKATIFLENSRTIANTYMNRLNSLIHGFRDISIHYLTKFEFGREFIGVSRDYRDNNIKAAIKFLNSGIIGNTFLITVLGVLSIVMPRVSTGVNTYTLISFVMVVLYIISPVNGVLGALPEITTIKVSWQRIASFLLDLEVVPAQKITFWEMTNYIGSLENESNAEVPNHFNKLQKVKSIEVKGLIFEYKRQSTETEIDAETFRLGPVDLKVKEGEVVFIIGGNGSGKSSLVHLITGLYVPDKGSITVNDKEVSTFELGEYFSAVFAGDHLFQKLYGIDLEGRKEEVEMLLRKLRLSEKVKVDGNSFSTVDLSSGQKKRLALLKCFLDNRQIFLFDELAADQDPEFRNYFYRELIPEMKKSGKIIIAITHDDHYFDVADRVIKLDYGTISSVTVNRQATEIV